MLFSQIIPQKVSDKCFWARVQEEALASNDILQGLSEKFSSKPARKKTEDSTDKYDDDNLIYLYYYIMV